MGNWIYGCDICQDVCPFNRFAQPTDRDGFAPAHVNVAAPPLLDLLALDEAGFQARFSHSPIKRIKRRRLLRNVCVAAGNWGSETAVKPLSRLLTDPEPLIRGHAAWALGQIGGPQATAILRRAGQTEQEDRVLAEMDKY
jgi:epoxyqueuosine reductase